MSEQPNRMRLGRNHWVNLMPVLALFSLAATFLPDAFYLDLLARLRIGLDLERTTLMLRQLRLYAPTLAVVALALWLAVRKLAPEIQTHIRFKSKIAPLLLQLHFLIFIPTIAYWFFYSVYWLTVPEAEWKQEMKVVPWHGDLPAAVERLRQQIPEDASILLILEGRGAISYAGYFNAYLYPRKVYVHRRQPGRDRMTRADVNPEALQQSGIDWIITYSGRREFDARQLNLERVP